MQSYTRRVGLRLSLIELPGGDCILWGGGEHGCLVYPVRPIQCQTFPFWREHLRSPESWRQLALRCPGVNNGTLHSLRQIEDRLRIMRQPRT